MARLSSTPFGRLAPGWTVAAASDWIWARSHVATWEHLVVERGRDAADDADRCVRSILAEVLTAADPC